MQAMFVYAGSLTADRAQQGIFLYRLDPATGAMDFIQRIEISSPGYLAFSPDRTRLYAASRGNTVDGGKHDLAVAYAVDRQSGRLELLDTTPIPPDPAFVAIDRTGSLAAFACTFGGAVAAVRIGGDGKFAGPAQVIPHEGRSLSSQGITPWNMRDPLPSGTPFPHSVRFSPDNRFLLVPDVGLNRVMVYRVDAATGRLTPNDPPWAEGAPMPASWKPSNIIHWDSPRGAGPRHLDFHPNGRWVYVVNELGSTVSVFDYDAARGALTMVQDITTLPDNAPANITADIHVHPSGKFLYATNRGHESLVRFAIDPERGTLTNAGWTPVRGEHPRSFTFSSDARLLLVGNLTSGSAALFVVDQSSGELTPIGEPGAVPSPSCLLLLD
jgi:6-phosphogluconolactonase